MNSAALHAHPFDAVGDAIRQNHVQPPPRSQKKVGSRVSDNAAGMRLLRAFELVDRLEAAAATARNGPIEMDQQSEVGKRPEGAPIAVWRIAARENVKAKRRGQQRDARPNGEYDQIVGGVGIGVQVLLQHGGTVRDHHRNHKHSACEGKNCNCRSVKLVWLAHRSQLHAISRTSRNVKA